MTFHLHTYMVNCSGKSMVTSAVKLRKVKLNNLRGVLMQEWLQVI